MAETGMAERELPHSKEAELSVIGSVLTDSDGVAASAEIIKADDFYYAANREIYKAVMELFNENIPVDIVTVSDRLKQHDKLDGIGGIGYLSSAVTGVHTTGNVEYYAKIIKEKAVLRRLISASSLISEMAYNEDGSIEKILESSEQAVFDVSSVKESNDIVPIQDVLMTAYQDMVENSINKGTITGVPTGFTELNNRTGGFHGGELIIIAGRPGMGKSSFAVNIAEHAAINDHVPVAIFNLEMSKTMIVNRILCSQALVDSHKVRVGDFDSEDWQQIGAVVDKIAMAPLFIDDTASITVSEIRAKCRRLKQTKNLGMVVIDYLQLMQSGGRTESRQQEISEISRSLKVLAKELDIPVIALSQLSRASESRSDKRPILSDLRESGAIEQDADIVMFLYRDEYFNPDTEDKNIAECIIAKHRSGSTGPFKLGWRGQYTKFVNIDYVAKEE